MFWILEWWEDLNIKIMGSYEYQNDGKIWILKLCEDVNNRIMESHKY